MILADKIIEERKRNGWSQEELAEKLQVSRQSVSKWEGALSIPDINRMIQMAELFGVSTDYLLKDELTRENTDISLREAVEDVRETRKVTMEEATRYLSIQAKFSPLVALGVSLCILSPVVLIVLAGFAEDGILGISENQAGLIGVITLLLMITVGVFTFIKYGTEIEQFEFLEKKEIDTEYGVDGMVKEKRNTFLPVFNRCIGVGVILCILCCVPLLIATFVTEKDYILCCMVGILLVMIATAVYLFVRVGMTKGSYDRLLQEGDYTVAKKKNSPVTQRVSTIYWLSVVAIYLAVSLPQNRWGTTWVIWPVAGVLFAVVITITKMIMKAED